MFDPTVFVFLVAVAPSSRTAAIAAGVVMGVLVVIATLAVLIVGVVCFRAKSRHGVLHMH